VTGNPHTTIRFGDLLLDLGSRELRHAGNTVHLSPKAFDLLAILVLNRPKALSKSELQEHLWPNTFVVEKNLSNLVSEIREALRDDPGRPRFVRTVPRFGYAFQQQPNEPYPAGPPIITRDVRFRVLWRDGQAGLSEGEHVLGRDPDLVLFFDSPSVSRRHALLRIAGSDAILQDLGSKNGTFINDRRIDSSVRLEDGDVVRIGSVEFTFRVIRTWGSTQTDVQSQ
jgi:DNA-binding winged helix-turn-helix (wHTH) protein